MRERIRVQKFFTMPSLTRQAHKDQCDVKKIVQKYRQVNGENLLLNQTASGGVYGDFTAVPDYRSAIEQVKAADDSFKALPAAVRKVFGNNPAELLDALGDPNMRNYLQSVGIIKADPEPQTSVLEAQ